MARNVMVGVRLDEATEHRVLVEAATQAGEPVATYMRRAALELARREVGEVDASTPGRNGQ